MKTIDSGAKQIFQRLRVVGYEYFDFEFQKKLTSLLLKLVMRISQSNKSASQEVWKYSLQKGVFAVMP